MDEAVKRALALIVWLLFFLTAAGTSSADGDGFKSGVFDPPREAPDFELSGSNGSTLTLKQLRGKVVILEFGFTFCPRVCPVTLANLAEVFKKLGPAAADVQLVFVTVDPDRDSPARLREFLQFFHPTFLGATGTEEKLDAVRQAYGVIATKAASENKKLGYEVHHSSSVYLIDREGKLRVLVPFGKSPDAIVHDIKLLLKK
jgi:protein SCO1